MKRLFLMLSSMALSIVVFAQTSGNIPVINAKVLDENATKSVVVKEPKVHFTSTQDKVFAVVDGTVVAVSNFNFVIQTENKYFVYQDVKGNPDLINKTVKRGDEIGSMYFNDDQKVYNLYISVMTGPKQYLSHGEVVKAVLKP